MNTATALAVPASRLAPAFGLYVHVPFCVSKCPYCDFNTYVGIDELAPAYFDAMLREAEAWASRGVFKNAGSVFVGGGTPSLVDEHLLAGFLRDLTTIFDVAPLAEITLEANPESTDSARLAVLREAGFNRISIGAQSFAPAVLAALGRAHGTAAIGGAVSAARAAGFDDLNLDLIYGTPGESDDDWRRTLHEAIALQPDHISCYALTIEPATAFGAAVASGRMPMPDDDAQADRYEMALDALDDAGYRHYELSNWGEPSRHNLVYWTQGEYVGLGAGAHSHVDHVRSWNRKNPRAYVDTPADARDGEERLDPVARAEEWLALRLRLVEGISLGEAERRTGRPLRIEAAALQQAGLVNLDRDHLALTRRGLLLESEVAIRLGA